jgi:hypothetical protein
MPVFGAKEIIVNHVLARECAQSSCGFCDLKNRHSAGFRGFDKIA